MFNLYVVLTGHDMVTDAGWATTCRRKINAPWLRTKVQKMKNLSETRVLTGKQFEDFRRKKNISSLDQKTPLNTWPLKTTIEFALRKQ